MARIGWLNKRMNDDVSIHQLHTNRYVYSNFTQRNRQPDYGVTRTKCHALETYRENGTLNSNGMTGSTSKLWNKLNIRQIIKRSWRTETRMKSQIDWEEKSEISFNHKTRHFEFWFLGKEKKGKIERFTHTTVTHHHIHTHTNLNHRCVWNKKKNTTSICTQRYPVAFFLTSQSSLKVTNFWSWNNAFFSLLVILVTKLVTLKMLIPYRGWNLRWKKNWKIQRKIAHFFWKKFDSRIWMKNLDRKYALKLLTDLRFLWSK